MQSELFKVEHRGKILSVVGIEKYHYAVKGEGNYVPKSQCEIIKDSTGEGDEGGSDLNLDEEDLMAFDSLDGIIEREKNVLEVMKALHQDSIESGDETSESQLRADIKEFNRHASCGALTDEVLATFEKKYNID